MRICYEERNLKLHNLYCGKILIKIPIYLNSRPFFLKGLVSFKGPVLFNQKIFNKVYQLNGSRCPKTKAI